MNYSKRVKRILSDAINSAKENGQNYVEPEHVFLAFLDSKNSQPIELLLEINVSLDNFKNAVYETLNPERKSETEAEIPFSKRLETVLVDAKRYAVDFSQGYISDSHVFLALLDNESIKGILAGLGVSGEELKESTKEFLKIPPKSSKSQSQDGGSTVQAGGSSQQDETTRTLWNKYAKNLNTEYREGKLNPMIGREAQLERIIYILSRKTKNNPILLGDAGVGKTAIVEGLAQRIEQNKVPLPLQNKTVFVLDLASVVAGTKFRGQFEARIKALIDEVERNKDEYIVFIDEIHTLMGAGSAEGSFDASNILKPALARGDFPCVGATTTMEYNKYLRKDLAIRRRFQPVEVPETSKAETLEILKQISPIYEDFHGVNFTTEVLKLIVDLSDKYINNRYFPDKAIDLLDECGASVKLNKLNKVSEGLLGEKSLIEEAITDALNKEKYSRLNELKQALKGVEKDIAIESKKQSETRISAQEKDIIKIVAAWSKVPVEVIEEQKDFNVNKVTKKLKGMVVGQDETIEKISSCLHKSKTPFRNNNQPIGSFLFSGSTGTGKTYLAKCLALNVFGSESNLITFNMSEYTNSTDVSKLIGASPQYVGYEDGHRFQEVQKRPYSVVLFDEIEKAHSSIWNILLSILSEGYIVDSLGEHISFRNTIVIISSNYKYENSSNTSFKGSFSGFDTIDSEEEKDDYDKLRNYFSEYFPPEFVNRLDYIITFKDLSKNDCANIAKIQLQELQEEIKQSGFTFSWTPKVVKFIGEKGYSEKYNARNVNRIIESQVKDLLINSWSNGVYKATLKIKNNKLTIQNDE